MAHLFILALSFVFISAGLIDREECCSEMTVGGVHYTLVEKTNTEVYNCLSNCVYIRTGDSGSRFCFAKGNQTVECNNAVDVVGILVAGGNDDKRSTELFLPGSGKGCKLHDLPVPGRFVCTLDTISNTGVLCGNGPTIMKLPCLSFSPNTASGTWGKYADMKEERSGLSSWVEPKTPNTEEKLLLMGGTPNFETTEIVNGGFSFNLVSSTIYACSISVAITTPTSTSTTTNYYVIITGGQFDPTGVTIYNTEGHVNKLPSQNELASLKGGRYHHGCGSYQDGTATILVVAGGISSDEKTILSSTEVFTIGSSTVPTSTEWTAGDALPSKGALYAMASVSYDNVIMLIGGNNDSPSSDLDKSTKQILSYIKDEATNAMIWKTLEVTENGVTTIVTLQVARSFGVATKLMVDPTVCG